jgi:hypothetical protein
MNSEAQVLKCNYEEYEEELYFELDTARIQCNNNKQTAVEKE